MTATTTPVAPGDQLIHVASRHGYTVTAVNVTYIGDAGWCADGRRVSARNNRTGQHITTWVSEFERPNGDPVDRTVAR